jgi:hypothetical protein
MRVRNHPRFRCQKSHTVIKMTYAPYEMLTDIDQDQQSTNLKYLL